MTNGSFILGSLTTVPVSQRPDLVAPVVLEALRAAGLLDSAGVVPVDPELSDTAATQEAYGLDQRMLANCVVVSGRREGVEREAACVVLATHRLDVNGVVRHRLDVRKASFMAREDAVGRTSMEYGAITPAGMPEGWPVLVDEAVTLAGPVVLGSGIRASKLVLDGADLLRLPRAELIPALGRPIPTD